MQSSSQQRWGRMESKGSRLRKQALSSGRKLSRMLAKQTKIPAQWSRLESKETKRKWAGGCCEAGFIAAGFLMAGTVSEAWSGAIGVPNLPQKLSTRSCTQPRAFRTSAPDWPTTACHNEQSPVCSRIWSFNSRSAKGPGPFCSWRRVPASSGFDPDPAKFCRCSSDAA
jgi:hypothetical protein